jgi:2-(1,2-epoxy-1,2-dihydrophenyl)acetyl-CoA isomerase
LAETPAPTDDSYLVDFSKGVLQLTFNRPEHGNAVPTEAVPGMARLLLAAQANPAVRCIMFAGNGPVFSAGGDVNAFARTLEQDIASRQADFAGRLAVVARLVEAIVTFDRPIVTRVRGAAAAAGLLYVLAADYAIGDETASIVFAHQRVGLSPDGGLSMLLPQVVGTRTARALMLTAARLDAAEAYRLGILNKIVGAAELDAEAAKIARRLAQAPQLATTSTKRLINAASHTPFAAQIAAETEATVACTGHPDFAEGVQAFLGKRSAVFPSTLMS